MKAVAFLGSSLDDLRVFPLMVRRALGYQIDRVQQGLEPEDWKPMASVGAGVREIRTRDATGAWRTIYIARFPEAVYILHCFQKKTPKTPKTDLDLARVRLGELLASKVRRSK